MTSRGLIQPVNKDENNDIKVVISYVYVFLVFAKNNRLYWIMKRNFSPIIFE